jgi:hypothetical protein
MVARGDARMARKAKAGEEGSAQGPGIKASAGKESAEAPPGKESSRARLKRYGLKKWQYIAINTFLIFHILAISCWCMPLSSPFIGVCREALRPYFVWSGLFQSWDMFSPQPKAGNSYLEALILYKDGSTKIWSFPRMEQLTLTEKYSKERYRKFVETLLDNKNADLWPDVARYVARLPETQAAGPPQKVMLVAKWSDIVRQPDGTFTRAPWDENVFYSYDVKPEDLQ